MDATHEVPNTHSVETEEDAAYEDDDEANPRNANVLHDLPCSRQSRDTDHRGSGHGAAPVSPNGAPPAARSGASVADPVDAAERHRALAVGADRPRARSGSRRERADLLHRPLHRARRNGRRV